MTSVPDAITIDNALFSLSPDVAWPQTAIGAAPTVKSDNEPLNLRPSHRLRGGLSAKWLAVQHALAGERKAIQTCREEGDCTEEARFFITLLERANRSTGIIRIREINRAFNLSIRSASDAEVYGTEEFWATPLTTLKQRAGDCEDIAIAKYLALIELGFTESDLRLVVIQEKTGGAHVITAVRHDERWLLLDNRELGITETLGTEERALFILDRDGARTAERSPAYRGRSHS